MRQSRSSLAPVLLAAVAVVLLARARAVAAEGIASVLEEALTHGRRGQAVAGGGAAAADAAAWRPPTHGSAAGARRGGCAGVLRRTVKDSDFGDETFIAQLLKPQKPLLLRGLRSMRRARRSWTRAALLRAAGDAVVQVGNAVGV